MKNHGRAMVSLAITLGLAGALTAGGLWVFHQVRDSLSPRISEKATLSILRSEALSFLVTRRTVTQIVVDYDQEQWFGDWRGVLWATVTWRWGVDLRKIQESDIHRQGDSITCRLPEPELLDFSVDPQSIGFMSKSTAIPKLMDAFGTQSQRKVMEDRLLQQTMKFASDRQLCPTRQDIARQLNEAAGTIKSACGVEIHFE